MSQATLQQQPQQPHTQQKEQEQTHRKQVPAHAVAKRGARPNYRGILKLAGLGLLGAGALIAITKFSEVVQDNTEVCELKTQVDHENLDMDPTAYKLLARIEKYAVFYPTCYDECIRAINKLFKIEKALRESNADATFEDLVRAETHFKAALANLLMLYYNVEKHHADKLKPKEILRFYNDAWLLIRFLGGHLQTIFAITSLL